MLDKILGFIADKLKGLDFTTQTFTSNTLTINANSVLGATQSFSIAKSGYTPLGIVDFNASNNYANILKANISGNTAYVRVSNLSNSQITTTVSIKVLYQKTT